jgi:hypothetical protein
MTKTGELSQAFLDFVLRALDHGFESIEQGGGPLVPFVLEATADGTRTLTRFARERLEDGVEAARIYVDASVGRLSMYAIVWDGYLTSANTRTDAILAEAAEQADENGVVFGQCYKTAVKGFRRQRICEQIGDPALVGRADSRFRGWSASGVIDLVTVSAAGDEVKLYLIMEEPWDEQGEEMMKLQAKLKNYVAYGADGQLHRDFPDTADMRVSIHIETRFPLGTPENKLVELARKEWCEPEQIELVVLPLEP